MFLDSYSDTYVRNLVDSALQKLYYDEHNISFFKHYNTFVIPLKSVNDAMLHSGNIAQILYHEYQPGTIKGAYAPMMDWVIALYNRYYSLDVTFDKFLDDAGVYSLHKKVYITYRESGLCSRQERIIPVETQYERETFTKGLIKIFNYVSERIPLLMVLNKLHFAPLSSFEFLYTLIRENANSKIAVICSFNEVYNVPDCSKTIRNNILMALEGKNLIQEWSLQDNTNAVDEDDIFVPVSESFERYLTLINNMIETVAVAQAIYYCDIVNENIENNNLSLNNEMLHRFYKLYAGANFIEGNYPRTLTICDIGRNLCESDETSGNIYDYTYLTGLCHSCAGQDSLAMKYVEECEEITRSGSDEYLQFESDLLRCMVMFRCWTNVYLWSVEYDLGDKFLQDAEKYEHYNHLAYIYLFCFGNSREFFSDDPNFCESHDHYKKGMYYADLLDNDSLRLRAYKKNVVFLSGFGYYPAVDHFYRKSLEILSKENNLLEMGNTYNGLGYNRIVSEEFEIADQYFNDGMEIWRKMRKPENMGETLYNMAVNAILARNYKAASEFLVTAVRVMKNLNQYKLDLCNMSKIYGMIVLCYIKMGVEYNAQIYLNKMQLILYHLIFPDKEPSYFLWDDDMFFYYFDRGLISRKESLAEAQQNFDRAKFHLKRTEGLWFFAYEFFALEQADLYRAQGRHVEANELLQKCLDYCTKNGYHNKIERLNSALRGVPLEEKNYNIGLKTVTSAQAVELSRLVGAELQLRLKNKSITFLTNWQELMNRDDINVDTLINTSMYNIQNNYNADKIIYLEVTNGKPDLVYCDDGYNPSYNVLQEIVLYFTRNPNEFMANRLEKSFYDYRDLIGLFGLNNIVSIIGVPIINDNKLQSVFIALIEMHDNFTNNFSLFLDGDLTIFSVAFHQLVDAINRLTTQERIKQMNRQLEQTSVTDALTGLYNRQGFVKTIREEMAKHSADRNVTVTVMYIDLDNFKFYNDTFGHDIGDALLVSFAEIFKQITQNRGYAIRYGGDEFVIVITDSSEEEGVRIAKSIYAKLDETNGFAERLKQKMGSDFVIPPEKRVSCSIGIATADEFTVDKINEAMKHADDALYVIKKTTKRNYKVWTPDISSSR